MCLNIFKYIYVYIYEYMFMFQIIIGNNKEIDNVGYQKKYQIQINECLKKYKNFCKY